MEGSKQTGKEKLTKDANIQARQAFTEATSRNAVWALVSPGSDMERGCTVGNPKQARLGLGSRRHEAPANSGLFPDSRINRPVFHRHKPAVGLKITNRYSLLGSPEKAENSLPSLSR